MCLSGLVEEHLLATFRRRGYVILDFSSRVAATLQGRPLPVGTNIELVLGDRIALVGVPLTMEVVA